VAPDISAYAAFFTESRVRLILSTNPNRKSEYVLGYSQPPLRGSKVSLPRRD
jgi:hypothetical protein